MFAVLSHDIYKAFESATGIKSYPLKEYSRLDAPVSSHSDMLICKIDNKVFCYEDYYKDNILTFKEIEKVGYDVCFVSTVCERTYPNDIALNALIIGKNIFCNVKHTAKEIIEYAKASGYNLHNVKQGYSACSTLVLDEKTAITGDLGMKIALESAGITVYAIDNGQVKLEGYGNGLIGGAGVRIHNSIYFFGSPDAVENLTDIINSLGYSLKQVSCRSGLRDFGGVKIF